MVSFGQIGSTLPRLSVGCSNKVREWTNKSTNAHAIYIYMQVGNVSVLF